MCIGRLAPRDLIEGSKGTSLVRSSIQTLGRSCVGKITMECGADSPSGAEDGSDTQPEIIIYERSRTRFVSMGHRIAEWYHGLFHLAQATIHDRWVKRFRLLDFVSECSIAPPH